MPLLLSKQINPYSAYAVWRISETTPQLKDKIKEDVPEMISSRQAEWIVTRILVEYLAANFEVPYKGVGTLDTGKPFLIDQMAEISISHSFPMAAAMISLNKPCGIDLELPRSKMKGVRDKFLHVDEKAISGIDNLETLGKIWTAKEVMYKYMGRKAVSLKDDIKVEFETDWRINCIYVKQNPPLHIQIQIEKVADFLLAYSF